MRKTSKVILVVAAGAMLTLGVVAGPGEKALAQSGIVEKKVEIVDVPTIKSPEQIGEEKRQEEVYQQLQEYISEGSKIESRTVDGVESQVKGLYYLDTIPGLAIVPSQDYYKAEGATGDPANAEIVAYETSEQKSPQAYECVKEVVAQQTPGAVVGPSVNIKVNWPEGEEKTMLVGDMKFGIDPSFAKEGSNYAVVAIYPGGFYQIYKDSDDNPDTISINAPVNYADNLAMYTLIRLD